MLENIKKCITEEQNLAKALLLLRSEINENKCIPAASRLEEIERNYNLMCDYMKKGYKDPQSDNVYNKLLDAALCLYNSLLLYELIRKNRSYADAKAKSKDLLSQPEQVYVYLENFVQEIALSSLKADNERDDILQDTFSKHQQYITCLFNEILVSDQWPENTRNIFTKILTSPAIDTNDAQMIVSAIMLSCMNIFDLNKWMTLVSAYENSTDEKVRQRALTGWVLSTPKENVYAEINENINRLTNNNRTRKELLELQYQLYYCNNTDADNEKIKRDIIPNLIKNNKFDITRTGIVEKEDDPMQDILNPGDADRELEEMEQSFNRMMDMQKSGSDIYFGGFAQMKRFPFFYQLCNWFCPFYIEHPQLAGFRQKSNGYQFIATIFNKGPFCDSDKYSFIMAMSSIFDSLPANVKEMLNNPDSSAFEFNTDTSHFNTPAYIRRMYLQDMYRFFRLYQYKNEFTNPFVYQSDTNLFLSNRTFSGCLTDEDVAQLDKFLFRHKCYHDIISLAVATEKSKNINHLTIVAVSYIKTERYCEAELLLNKVIKQQPDNEQALKSMAQLSFLLHKYEQSAECYNRLLSLHPDNKYYSLNLAIAQISNDKTEEGMNGLFKLSFEYPDDDNINRALAWGYLVQGKADNAFSIYDTLINNRNHIAADYLNAGYAKWFLSDITSAISLFRKYMSSSENKHDISENFDEDKKLMDIYNVTTAELKIMTDLVDREEN